MGRNWELETKVGVFIVSGLTLILLAILLLGGPGNLFSRNNTYEIHYPSVEGLISGSKVVLGGLQVGTVNSVDFDANKKDIKVIVLVGKKYEEWIRKDSTSEIMTQGVLGDKFISIQAGAATAELLPSGSEIPTKPSEGLAQFISKGDQLLISLTSIANGVDRLLKSLESDQKGDTIFKGLAATSKNLSLASQKLSSELDQIELKKTVHNLHLITEKINNGTGTLGALVNDPGLYYDAKSLMGGANRNRIIRNLVRKTIKNGEEGK